MRRSYFSILLLALTFFPAAIRAAGPVYRLLYSPPPNSAIGNLGTMFEASPGLFYVLSQYEGASSGPSIITVTSTGIFKLIYTFPVPYNTFTNVYTLVQATNGALYGAGTSTNPRTFFYFSIAPSGLGLNEYPFSGGWGSIWQTIVAPPGELYDLVAANPSRTSTVYGFANIGEAGKITILHEFSTSEGVPLGSNILYGPDGNIYGVGNQQRNASGAGFIFRFTPSGAYSQLLTFPTFPMGVYVLPLTSGADGNLYGTFGKGGTNNTGEIYQATLSGQLQSVASFPATGMNTPLTITHAADGNLYGTTNSNAIFRYDLSTKQLNLVYQLNPGGSQGHCPCQLIEGMDGKLYGDADRGQFSRCGRGVQPGDWLA